MSGGVCAILLAAGLGTRFRQVAGNDSDKLLARCHGHDGHERTVLEHALRSLCGQVARTLLVTRPENRAAIDLGLAHGCELVTLESAGMGDSIAAAVVRAPDCAGWLIALGDMPCIRPATVAQVAAALRDELIVVPTWQGRRGHPVGFGRAYGGQLVGLSGDTGAKRLFRDGQVFELAVDDPAIVWDIDTPEALSGPRA
ncbi:hypothetical protein YO5_06631 [Stutzerimonas stutzeri TS44]|nr:hypothetical protein YO5_06631 [Stutzerimonas stutzeri TS44]